MRMGMLLGVMLWAMIGCTVVMWSTETEVNIEDDTALIVIEDSDSEQTTRPHKNK